MTMTSYRSDDGFGTGGILADELVEKARDDEEEDEVSRETWPARRERARAVAEAGARAAVGWEDRMETYLTLGTVFILARLER